MRSYRSTIFVLLLCIGGVAGVQASSHFNSAEYNIKAAFLYKFASYVEWPTGSFTSDSSPIVFGVIGAELLAGQLEDVVRGRQVNGRELLVRRLQLGDPIDGLHVLFIGRSQANQAGQVLSDATAMSILTITETDSPRLNDSVINFEIINDKVSFDVAIVPARRGGLRISSRLLQVAHRILDAED